MKCINIVKIGNNNKNSEGIDTKMNKIIITMICIIVILVGIVTGVILVNSSKNENENAEYLTTEIAEKEEILDECTDEYEQIQSEMLEANSEEEKISPNSSLTKKIYYSKCGHTIREYSNMPEELVNKTKEQVKEIYSDWEIETFASNEIILFKESDGECGEHYLVKDNNGKVSIYQIQENGEEVIFENTEITTEYLPETDKINMKNGIEVNGKEELNQLIEDFE